MSSPPVRRNHAHIRARCSSDQSALTSVGRETSASKRPNRRKVKLVSSFRRQRRLKCSYQIGRGLYSASRRDWGGRMTRYRQFCRSSIRPSSPIWTWQDRQGQNLDYEWLTATRPLAPSGPVEAQCRAISIQSSIQSACEPGNREVSWGQSRFSSNLSRRRPTGRS